MASGLGCLRDIVYICLVVACISQCVLLTYDYLNESLGTHEFATDLEDDLFPLILFCVKGVWKSVENLTSEQQEELKLLLGYRSGNMLFDDTLFNMTKRTMIMNRILGKMNGKDNDSTASGRIDWLKGNEIWKAANEYHDAYYAYALNEGRENVTKKMTLQPTLSQSEHMCGKAYQFKNKASLNGHHSEYETLGQSWRVRKFFMIVVPRYPFGLAVNDHKYRSIWYSLYQGPLVYLMDELVHFEKLYGRNPSDKRHNEMALNLRIIKHVRLNTKRSTCQHLQAMEDGKTPIYPLNFATRVCEKRCESKAYMNMYNCSKLAIFGKAAEPNESLKPCNLYELGIGSKQGNVTKEIAKRISQCVESSRCSQKRFCTEWEIVLIDSTNRHIWTKLQPRYVTEQLTTRSTKRPKQASQAIILLTPQRFAAVQDYYRMTTETWFSGMGGLSGIWIGMSMYQLASFIAEVTAEIKRKLRGQSESSLSTFQD